MVDAIVLAIALAMDATAVATACGAAGTSPSVTTRMAWLFAVFHVAMCTLGWTIGATAERWIEDWDHWVAFGLLAVIGGKMVWSAWKAQPVQPPTSWKVLLGLAVATSLDAVAAGVTLPLVEVPEVVTITAIGVTVFALVLVGARVGARLGDRFGRVLQITGGLAIIALGAKTAAQHVW